MLIYDMITTNLDFDLSVPCEWAHYKLYKNAVGIEHSKPKLWLNELEQITTKPISMDVNLRWNFEGKNTEWAHYKLYKNYG